MNISIDLVNVNGMFEDDIFDEAGDPTDETLTANASVSLPSGSLLSDVENTDYVKVVAGGPLVIQGSGGNLKGSLTVKAGECFDGSSDEDFPLLVDCPAI